MTIEAAIFGLVCALVGAGATVGAAFRSWGKLQAELTALVKVVEQLSVRVDGKADRDSMTIGIDRLERAIAGLTARIDRWMERQP